MSFFYEYDDRGETHEDDWLEDRNAARRRAEYAAQAAAERAETDKETVR